jgi:hypothetical protein
MGFRDCRQHLLDVIALQQRSRLVAMFGSKFLNEATARPLCLSAKFMQELSRPVIGHNQRVDGAKLSPARTNIALRGALTVERRCSGRHVFRRPRHPRQCDAFESGSTEIITRLSMPIDEPTSVGR